MRAEYRRIKETVMFGKLLDNAGSAIVMEGEIGTGVVHKMWLM